MSTAKKLTDKQQRFVEEYLVDLNATQAAIRAGYSKKTAKVIAAQNLSKLNVAAEIQSGRQKLSEKTGVTAERVIAELALVAFTNMQDYFRVNSEGQPELDCSTLTKEQAAALSEVTAEEVWRGKGDDAKRMVRTKFKLHSKMSALDQLGKYFGLFITKVEHTGKDGGPIITADMTDKEACRLAAYFMQKDADRDELH